VNVVMAAMKALGELRSAQRIREMRGVEVTRRREPEGEPVAP
jgi:ribosomal protein S5